MNTQKYDLLKRVIELESRRYLSNIDLLASKDVCYSMPIARYILSSYACLPVKTVIVGERPYATDIHPFISSAMSYDPSKSRATPSTVGLARDMNVNFGTTYLEVENWFRDSWKHLASGVLVVNCNVFLHFSSSRSQLETVPFQMWMRAILDCSMALSDDKIDVVCMGVPSQNVVDSMLRSIGNARRGINKKVCLNPAALAKSRVGDGTSRACTLGKKDVSKAILVAIRRSKTTKSLTANDYATIVCRDMSAQIPQVDKLLQSANDVASQVEDAYKELEGNHKLPAFKDAVNSFTMAMIEYRDSVLKDIVVASIVAAGDNSGKVAKSTEWGSKKPWQKGSGSVGTSSRMSTVTEDIGGVEQKFEDDAAEPIEFADEAGVEEAPAKEMPKKKIVKRVRKVKKQPGLEQAETTVGSQLSEAAVSTLKSVSYFISDRHSGASKGLEESVTSSIYTGKAADRDVCLVVDTAAMDLRSTGTAASASLGIDDGEVSETCTLPKLIEKLVATVP